MKGLETRRSNIAMSFRYDATTYKLFSRSGVELGNSLLDRAGRVCLIRRELSNLPGNLPGCSSYIVYHAIEMAGNRHMYMHICSIVCYILWNP